jgi:hypothetical protein
MIACRSCEWILQAYFIFDRFSCRIPVGKSLEFDGRNKSEPLGIETNQ